MTIYKYLFISILVLIIQKSGLAQNTVSGTIVDERDAPIGMVSLHWRKALLGSQANENGVFSIEIPYSTGDTLLFDYVGYQTKEVFFDVTKKDIIIKMQPLTDLRAVQVTAAKRDNFTSTLSQLNVEKIGSGELRKAACCNLSESFETNGTVDVAYTDAVTGAKEIEMLGLRGVYTQMMVENRPDLYALGAPYGLEYFAGTWLNDISISKGASTVANGAEGIVGQINVCLKQPDDMERLLVNIFANTQGRTELNLHLAHKFNKKISTSILAHADKMQLKQDFNNDGFMDMPHREQYNVMSLTKYEMGKWRGQTALHYLTEKRAGGMMPAAAEAAETAHAAQYQHGSGAYNFGLTTDRKQIFGKLGYVGFTAPYKNFGSMYSFTQQTMSANFGTNRSYAATQTSGYVNMIYETIIDNTDHKLKMGTNYYYNDYKDLYSETTDIHSASGAKTTIDLSRREHIPGAFLEYNYSWKEKFGLLLGVRADYRVYTDAQNVRVPMPDRESFQVAPRVSLKYNFNSETVVRASAGRGVREARVLPENMAVLVSNRNLQIANNLQLEKAWNYGVNFTRTFKIDMHDGAFNIDAYRTDFENQVFVDMDAPTVITIQNLANNSVTHSVLLSGSYYIVPRLEVRATYKFTDAFANGLQRQLVPKHRGLLNLHYETFDKVWNFNAVTHYIGAQRITDLNSVANTYPLPPDAPDYRRSGITPAYFTVGAQVNKLIGKHLEVYIGGENLTNYRQAQPILYANDPTNPLFDAATIFAPVAGSAGYIGIKYRID